MTIELKKKNQKEKQLKWCHLNKKIKYNLIYGKN